VFPRGRSLYIISDRLSYPGDNWVADLAAIAGALPSGSAMVQLREKDLGTRSLLDLAAKVQAILSPLDIPLLINDRMDVALAVGAAGVHLRTTSFSVAQARSLGGDDFIIGASTHSFEEAKGKADEGADFVVLGPIWDTPSKAGYGQPLGMNVLQQSKDALLNSSTAVFALGGVTSEARIKEALAAADGVAGIRLFQDPSSPAFRFLQG
jgi:thiamine-phosphate pyrophosphorylase